jgi:hypothetical protein
MLASAQDRRVLDNIAEALQALPEEKRGDHTVRKVVRHFNEQDLALQAKMRERGLFRWGSTWVAAADLARLQAAEREVQMTLDRMAIDFEALGARIQRMDRDVETYERIQRRMEWDSWGRDAEGRAIRYPLPPSYYDYQRDIAALRSDRAAAIAEQQAMRRQAEQVLQRLPTQKYTGVQRLIDVEGAPLPGAAELAMIAPPAVGAPPAPVPMPIPAPVPAPPPNGGGPIAVPVEPGPAPAPAPVPAPAPAPAPPNGAANPPATQPAKPPRERVIIPPEKPSILDRRFLEDPIDPGRYRDPGERPAPPPPPPE